MGRLLQTGPRVPLPRVRDRMDEERRGSVPSRRWPRLSTAHARRSAGVLSISRVGRWPSAAGRTVLREDPALARRAHARWRVRVSGVRDRMAAAHRATTRITCRDLCEARTLGATRDPTRPDTLVPRRRVRIFATARMTTRNAFARIENAVTWQPPERPPTKQPSPLVI